ncbi:MAG: hypothetical protein K2N56_02790 [Oscillospiraceae bacterium]|nr:hypothetical protein [Oscillospiraceae bacterium]
MNIHDLVQRIRVRTPMYIGANSISALHFFLNGYNFAKWEAEGFENHAKNDPAYSLFPLDFWYFHEFAKIKVGAYSSVPGWRNLILKACGGDEKKGLETFFTMYDEFEQLSPVRYWKAVLTAENIAYNDDCQHCYRMSGTDETKREPVYTKPLAAYIIELDLTGKTAFLLVVETEETIEVKNEFYESFEQAAQNQNSYDGAATYFGKIDNWQELDEPPEFNKPINM